MTLPGAPDNAPDYLKRAAPPKVLALDLSLTSTGVVQPSGEIDVWAPKALTGVARLAELTRCLRDVIIIDPPELVVLEDYAYAARYSGHQAGELGGCIRLSLFHKGIPFVEVAPTALKKFATGSGKGSKDKVLAAAVREGAPVDGNDEADAWWLHELAIAAYGAPSVTLTQYRLDVIGAIAWPTLGGAET